MQERLYELLMQLPKKNLINLMWGALDEMQAYNGRTKTYCILIAMGSDCVDPNHLKFNLPPLSEIKNNTDSMGF